MQKKVKISTDIELFYEEYGEGTPLLFIPGLTCTTEFFQHNLEALSSHYRVLCYDPRSQGNSTVTEFSNDFVQRGRDLEAFIAALELEDIIIAGWSLGAYDAYSYFQEFGLDKVKAFINIDMPPKVLQIQEDDWAEGPLEVVRAMNHSILAVDQAHFFAAYAQYMIIREASDEEVDWIVTQSAKTPLLIASQIVADATLCDFSHLVCDIATKIPVMHFIKEDWSETAIKWLDTHTPEVRKEVMGGHMMFWEESFSFNAKLLSFLKDI